jgi:hypothetical protein
VNAKFWLESLRESPLGRTRCRWDDSIKMDLAGSKDGGCDWINLAHDRHQWCAFVKMVMNLLVT